MGDRMNEHITYIICITVLLIFCVGSPDLLDAIIHWMMQP